MKRVAASRIGRMCVLAILGIGLAVARAEAGPAPPESAEGPSPGQTSRRAWAVGLGIGGTFPLYDGLGEKVRRELGLEMLIASGSFGQASLVSVYGQTPLRGPLDAEFGGGLWYRKDRGGVVRDPRVLQLLYIPPDFDNFHYEETLRDSFAGFSLVVRSPRDRSVWVGLGGGLSLHFFHYTITQTYLSFLGREEVPPWREVRVAPVKTWRVRPGAQLWVHLEFQPHPRGPGGLFLRARYDFVPPMEYPAAVGLTRPMEIELRHFSLMVGVRLQL